MREGINMSKYQDWYDNQPAHVRAWMDKQAVWNDIDLFKMLGIGFLIGLCIGYIL